MTTAPLPAVARLGDGFTAAATTLLAHLGCRLVVQPAGSAIAASHWGEPEAGIDGLCIVARPDTPLHSVLHETGHLLCTPPAARPALWRSAGSDDLEEAAVCCLQVRMADRLAHYGRARLFADMQSWGYSFRLGSAADWYASDAEDALAWLAARPWTWPRSPTDYSRRGYSR